MIVEAKSAQLSRRDGEFFCEPGVVGIEILKEDTVAAIEKAVCEDWSEGDLTVAAVVQETQPKYTEADFAKVTDLMGSSYTIYTGSEARVNNLKNATAFVDGTVLLPGEQFDMFKTVSPFTPENGYEEAGQYSNGELIQGYGGGICQVTTTLYLTALKSELQIDARSPHSMLVHYVPKSFDAAIAGDYKNFKFTNTTNYPIYIEGYLANGKIYFNMYGCDERPSNRTIEFESRLVSTIAMTPDETTVDPTLPVGYVGPVQAGHEGYVAEM